MGRSEDRPRGLRPTSVGYTGTVSDGLRQLIARIDDAVRLGDSDAITQQVKQELQDAIRARAVELPSRFHRVRADSYARRLLHRNDALGYTAVVMTWGPGQRTPLHDHAGIWCVEGVVEGRMDVTQFDLIEDPAGSEGGAYRFAEKGCVHAAVGSAGCLIPPFEYHVLANALDQPSITLHVYGGEMTTCHVFEPAGGGRYVRRDRALSYDE
jgi:predicted metal-dependent enzyme (double-stranded beta helix superfamily)